MTEHKTKGLKRSPLSRTSKSDIGKLKRKLDIAFAKMIRERDKGLHCISCTEKGTQSGHFRRRELMSTRWNPLNSNLQCSRCNCWLSGNEYAYAIGLDKKWGKGTSKELYLLSRKTKQWSIWELEALIKATKNYEDYVWAYKKIMDLNGIEKLEK